MAVLTLLSDQSTR